MKNTQIVFCFLSCLWIGMASAQGLHGQRWTPPQEGNYRHQSPSRTVNESRWSRTKPHIEIQRMVIVRNVIRICRGSICWIQVK